MVDPYPYLWLDPLTQKVREDGRTVNVSVVVATVVYGDGKREIIGMDVGTSEPVFPILGVFRLKGQSKREGSIIVRSCKATQSPVYPIRDAFAVVEHPSCPSSSSSCPLPVG